MSAAIQMRREPLTTDEQQHVWQALCDDETLLQTPAAARDEPAQAHDQPEISPQNGNLNPIIAATDGELTTRRLGDRLRVGEKGRLKTLFAARLNSARCLEPFREA